jgi:hypothetical protein
MAVNISRTSPASDDEDILSQKSDTVDLTRTIRGFHVNVDGTIYGIMADGTAMRNYEVKAGMYYPYCFKRVGASTTLTGTQAWGLI